LTGVLARSAGVKRDLRLNKYTQYNSYNNIKFSSYYSTTGDSYDRYLLRMFEMISSNLIIVNAIQKLKCFHNNANKNYLFNNYMEGAINSFKY
jgi:NADH-quinone oxidoreductase subunit D